MVIFINWKIIHQLDIIFLKSFTTYRTSISDKDKKILDKLKKAIEKKYSKTLTDEEIIERCLKFSKKHLDKLFDEVKTQKESKSKKVHRIIKNAKEYKLDKLDKSNDELLYGIKED